MAARKLTEQRLDIVTKLGLQIPESLNDEQITDLIDTAVAEQKLLLAGHGPPVTNDITRKKKP